MKNPQTATVHLKENMTVEEFLASACGKRGLNPAEHFVRVKKRRDMDNSNHFVPHRTDLIDSYVRIVPLLFTIQYIHLNQPTSLSGFPTLLPDARADSGSVFGSLPVAELIVAPAVLLALFSLSNQIYPDAEVFFYIRVTGSKRLLDALESI